MLVNIVTAALACASAASAHGYIERITANGQTVSGYNPSIYPWEPVQTSPNWAYTATDLGFVSANNLQNADIICHRGGVNAGQTITVAAGSTVQLKWNTWPDSHHGPVIDYLAACNGDCRTVSKSNLRFVKIFEQGQISYGSGAGQVGKWASDRLFDQGLVWSTQIPQNLKAGNYILRHELLALHSAYTRGEAQFYPQCVNLVVTGSGATNLPGGTAGTSLYTIDHPGVLYNIYNDEARPTYQIPGPALVKI